VCAQITDACHAGGLKLGWYYSPADWHHPASRQQRWGEYTPFMQAQLRELFTRFGQVDMLFFDYWQGCVSDPSWAEFYRELRRLQPRYLHNRNTPWYAGDYECYEMNAGPFVDVRNPSREKNPEQFSRMVLGDPWEICHSLENTWSYQGDVSRGSKWIIQLLVRCAGCDGNFLLNVTPDSRGQVPPSQVRDLRETGAWLERYGQSIYGTRGGPVMPLYGPADDAVLALGEGMQLTTVPTKETGRLLLASTRAGSRVYLHVPTWPGEREIVLPPMAHRVVSARLLTGGQVRMRSEGGRTHLFVVAPHRDAVDTLIVLDLDGPTMDINPVKAELAAGPS
jgi:alpha-L-fucosidase